MNTASSGQSHPADVAAALSIDVRPPDFSPLASLYRWMEWASFGPWLWWCRCAFLRDLRAARSALVIGDGDGRFTARLLEINPQVRVDAIDASDAMLRALERHAGVHAARVQTSCQDARTWRPANRDYDLIATHFFLDCLTTGEVQALAARVREGARPGAGWVISEFAVPAGWFGSLLARPLVWALYWAFGVLTGLKLRRLPDWPASLRAAGFAPIKQRRWLRGLLVSELWALRHDV